MPASCSMLGHTYYAQNYAGIKFAILLLFAFFLGYTAHTCSYLLFYLHTSLPSSLPSFCHTFCQVPCCFSCIISSLVPCHFSVTLFLPSFLLFFSILSCLVLCCRNPKDPTCTRIQFTIRDSYLRLEGFKAGYSTHAVIKCASGEDTESPGL